MEMDYQLQAQVTTILTQIATSVGEQKDYSVEQLPEIAQQYITYGIWSSSIYMGISFVSLIICLILFYKAIRSDFDKWSGEAVASLLGFSIAIGIINIFTIFNKLHNLILVTTAPKVWFILELKNLIS